jgi:trk system potassium uptake protein TrkA
MEIVLYGATEISYLIAARLHQDHNLTLLPDPGEASDRFANLDVALAEGSGGDS